MKAQLQYKNPSSLTSVSSTDAELLKLLLEHSRELLVVLDADMKILTYNSKAAEMAMIVLKHKLAPGKYAEDVVLEERRPFLKQLQLKLLAGETIEYSFTSPQPGPPVVYLVKFTPVFDNENQLNKIIFSGLDISKETKAMQEIIASKSLLQQAESITRIGSWEWDIKSNRILWSDEFCRICGVEPGEIPATKENGFAFIHPAEKDMAEKILENTFKTGNPYSIELRLITHSGALKYVHSRGIIIRNKTGWNEKFIGTFHDITALKILENSIEQTQLKFQYLIEHSVDVMLLVNDKREIIFASPSVHQMMGYEPGEIIGIRLGALTPEEDLKEMLVRYEKIVSSPELPITMEYRVKTKDGKVLWVEGTINNLLHREGINSIVINQRDISKRKETETLMHQLNENLEKQARELIASNIELERFAYIASHDLQEPVRMVNGFLKLLQKKYESQLDSNALQYIHYAVDAGDRMKMLINALLEYSRLGTKKLVYGPVDMNEEIKRVIHLFDKMISSTGAVIAIKDLPVIYADKIQMRQLLQNLVGNALKYRAQEPPEINISAENNNDFWIFCIADNGIGINKKDSSRIFEIFQRLHIRNEYSGTGIGLSICKKIVEIHGGKIWMEPNEPTGTEFYFSIKKLNTV